MTHQLIDNQYISGHLVIWSFEIFLKSWLTNVKGILLRITPLGRVFKIPKKIARFC